MWSNKVIFFSAIVMSLDVNACLTKDDIKLLPKIISKIHRQCNLGRIIVERSSFLYSDDMDSPTSLGTVDFSPTQEMIDYDSLAERQHAKIRTLAGLFYGLNLVKKLHQQLKMEDMQESIIVNDVDKLMHVKRMLLYIAQDYGCLPTNKEFEEETDFKIILTSMKKNCRRLQQLAKIHLQICSEPKCSTTTLHKAIFHNLYLISGESNYLQQDLNKKLNDNHKIENFMNLVNEYYPYKKLDK